MTGSMLNFALAVTPKSIRSWAWRRIDAYICAQPMDVAEAMRNLHWELKIARRVRRVAPALKQIQKADGLKLNLGCGNDLRPGWVNIDLELQPSVPRDPHGNSGPLAVCYDLRKGLPFRDRSCSYIYASHAFEHLDFVRHGHHLMRECYRALEPEGVFRIVLPDMKRIFVAYLEGDRGFFKPAEEHGYVPHYENGVRRMTDFVNWAVYQGGQHKFVFDGAMLSSILENIGFGSATVTEYRKEIDRMDGDRAILRHFSFYVEAVK